MKKLILVSIISSLLILNISACTCSNNEATGNGESGQIISDNSSVEDEYSGADGSDENEGSDGVEENGDDSQSDDGQEILDDGGETSDSQNDINGDEDEQSSSELSDDTVSFTGNEIIGDWAPYAASKTDNPEIKVSVKSLFGDDFRFGGAISFNDDNSFYDTIIGSRTGQYTFSDGVVSLSYEDGSNVELLLTGYPDSPTLEQTIEFQGENVTLYYTM